MVKGLVSVIIPVYNTEEYIKRCLNSVLKQSYKQLEVLCVDDGSTDNSGKILDEFATMDNRVKVFHITNSGSAFARNVALEYATGEYIGFIDSDDYIEENMYEILIRDIIKYNVDIVSCGYFIDTGCNSVIAKNNKQVPNHPIPISEFMRYTYERDVYKGVAGYLWTKLIRYEVLKEKNGKCKVRFIDRFRTSQDIIFIAQLNLLIDKIYYEERPLYHYYQRINSMVHSKEWLLKSLQWTEAYEYIIDLYKSHFINQDIIDLLIRMYVYRCGKLLEIAIESKDKEKILILSDKIKTELPVYVKTNISHIERIHWLITLLLQGNNE